ncbi:MAG: glycoside hydrolase [bacterium]|nr:glycoside hydrolase [bacterium]
MAENVTELNEAQMLDTQMIQVLKDNDKNGKYTVPAEGLYPHQWLWDSAFISIGIAHYDIARAEKEILRLFKAQWKNGMIPHMILADKTGIKPELDAWRSSISPLSPKKYATSGITQPPVLAEAVVQIGRHLSKPERRSWYKRVYPGLIKYHQWLYEDRDPHKEGLVLNIHPWETGMDNTPPWMVEMNAHQPVLWIRIVEKLRLDTVLQFMRSDKKYIMSGQRIATLDALRMYSAQRRLRRKQYDIDKILKHGLFAVEDVMFNSILIRNNKLLEEIAKTLNRKIPEPLTESFRKNEFALEQLWDGESGMYFNRNFITHDHIKIPTIATLMPLYAGCLDKERTKQLIALLKTSRAFSPKYPIPTVPTTSKYFSPHGYWQGPTWINMNWMLIDGLRRSGEKEMADILKSKTIELVEKAGPYEYFSPRDGSSAGAKNFSWTAALTLDLLKN